MKILLTYDIANTKKRTKLSTLLEGYGLRVNYSVFELDIKKKKLMHLISIIETLSDKNDSVRLYWFSQDTIMKSKELKNRSQPFVKESAYVD